MVAKMSSESENDRFDRAILEILAKDGRITITDLAQRVGLSKTPTQVRLRRLIENGTIMGFRAVHDPTRLGLDHVAFTQVKLSDTRATALRELNAAVRQIAVVEERQMIDRKSTSLTSSHYCATRMTTSA